MKWQDNKELKRKQQRLNELSKLIQLHGGQLLTREKKQAIENMESKLEFRLNELVLKSKLEELDIRIGVYEETLKIINNNELY